MYGFGNRGRVHAREPEQLQRNMDCRRLISNIIVLLNTRYIATPSKPSNDEPRKLQATTTKALGVAVASRLDASALALRDGHLARAAVMRSLMT